MTQKTRIKDIALKAGVSVGTVDRVLHDRPNVSKEAREKVEKVLKEINYQPNAYASALAYNKSYTFYSLTPLHTREVYWDEVERGARKAVERLRDFHISMEQIHYRRFDPDHFRQQSQLLLEQNPAGVVLVPSELSVTRELTDELHARDIPFILLDSYMPDLAPLSFYGQDAFKSGYFAAKMLMLVAGKETQIMLMKQTHNGRVESKQQANREVGFRHYMADHFPQIEIIDLELPVEREEKGYDAILRDFFNGHPGIHHCVTLCSKAYLVADWLLRTNRRNTQIMGYDVVERNRRCLKEGAISFLIAQHAYLQGYSCVDTLFRAIVLKKKVPNINYMPIELLTIDNVDFYQRTRYNEKD